MVPLAQVALSVPAAPHARLAGVPLLMPPGDVPAGVPSSITSAAVAGTVPVTTVLCVVLGMLLCLALGALAVQVYRAWARRRGGSQRVCARAELLWGSQGSPTVGRLRRVGTPGATHGPHSPG